jgi:exopolysaccharide biosynthesis protein
MYTICFTIRNEHEWFNYDSKKEANKKFNALKKRVDEYAAKSIYSSVSMSSVSIYGEEEQTYDNWDRI